ncbi:MAG: flavodoxin family protein [Candidatus Eisenbacteria bacterium]
MSDDTLITAILGSPRRNGNSDRLAVEFLRGASSAGSKHRLIVPSDLGVAPCDGGNQCFSDGKCIIRDGMNEIYDDVLASRYLLIATPVYFMGPPGALKGFIDRFQAVWARSALTKTFDPDSEERRRSHKGFAIIVGATPDKPSMYRPTSSIIKAFFNVTGFDHAGEMVATGLDRLDDVGSRQDLMKEAFEAGQAFVS